MSKNIEILSKLDCSDLLCIWIVGVRDRTLPIIKPLEISLLVYLTYYPLFALNF